MYKLLNSLIYSNSLKNRKKDDENKKSSLPVTDSTNILRRQIYAVSQSPLYGTKMEQSEEITKILDAFSKWKVLEYEELYKKMMHIMEYDEIYEKSKEKTFRNCIKIACTICRLMI